MDPVITDSDRRAYNDEFNTLVLQLEELMSSEYQGRGFIMQHYFARC